MHDKLCRLVPKMLYKLPHIWPNPLLLHQLEALLPVSGIKSLGEIKEDPAERGLFDVGELLGQHRLNQSRACPPLVTRAMKAIMKPRCVVYLILAIPPFCHRLNA